MKKIILFLVFLAFQSQAQSFKKGYKKYKKQDYTAASKIFEAQAKREKHQIISLFLLEKIKAKQATGFPDYFLANAKLTALDSNYRKITPKNARKQQKKYNFDLNSIYALHLEMQVKAIALARTWGTIAVFDSLQKGIPNFLPALQPTVDSLHFKIIHENIPSEDYDVMTAIKKSHLQWVLPEDYVFSRRLGSQLWPRFLEKYGACQLDKFIKDHPISLVANDCWNQEAKTALCSNKMHDLLFFWQNYPHSVLEYQVMRAAFVLEKETKDAEISPIQKEALTPIKQYFRLSGLVRNDEVRDTIALLSNLKTYIKINAPRNSAYRLMQEGLQFFLEKEAYSSAIELLLESRTYFLDSLPANCKSDFDYQRRTRPYIDAIVPILNAAPQKCKKTPIDILNSANGDEFSPLLTADENIIYFAARGREDNLEGVDIFSSKKVNNKWQKPEIVADLSGKGDQTPISLTADGKNMLIETNGKTYQTTLKSDGKWTKPSLFHSINLPIVGKIVYFPKGDGVVFEGSYEKGSAMQEADLDLFVLLKSPDGTWGNPIALGPEINTDGNETNPYLLEDGKTLYYTSAGYPGLGGGDVFVSQRTGEKWANWNRPKNLGKEVNDTFRHTGFGFVKNDKKKAFFTKKDGDKGKMDIWELTFQ
jgi:hypothetical protein